MQIIGAQLRPFIGHKRQIDKFGFDAKQFGHGDGAVELRQTIGAGGYEQAAGGLPAGGQSGLGFEPGE